MIEISMTGTLPTFDESALEQTMEDIADVMFRSVHRNFDLEGGSKQGPWPPLKYSRQETPLVLSGRMRNSIYKQNDKYSAEVGVPDSIEYAGIHNFGGTINHPGTSNGFGRGIKIPPHSIRIPQREFILFQDEDVQDILNMIGNDLTVKFFKPEPITKTA